jgi:hypothetical protein
MSRLIDKLNQISQTAPQPMGFASAKPVSPKPKLLLVASLSQVNLDNLGDHVDGADGGLLNMRQSSKAKALREASQAVPDIPWGIRIRDNSQTGIQQITKTACDFVVFPADNTSFTILQNKAVGKILEVEVSLNDGLLKTINKLPIDAVLITGEPRESHFLTWHHLMLIHRFTSLLTKSLLISVPPTVTADELQVLWEAGVDGAIVEIVAGQNVGQMNQLSQAIDKLTLPSQLKRRKADALIPHIEHELSIVANDEDGEEEEG